MSEKPRLRLPPDKAEQALSYFRNKGNQFHLMATTSPQLEEDLNLFVEWELEVRAFLTDAFATAQIADDFRAIFRIIEVHYDDDIKYSQAVFTCVRRTLDFLENLEHTLALYDSQNPPMPSALEILDRICSRFDTAVRQLRYRYNKRPTLDVDDEHDLQDLMHSLLKVFFNDIRPEEYSPSFAGAASRIDFLLKEEQILFEAKMSRPNLNAKELGEELIVDIERYKVHPDCKFLYCFVYDPKHYIKNPHGIENDLNRAHPNRSGGLFPVKVFIAPE